MNIFFKLKNGTLINLSSISQIIPYRIGFSHEHGNHAKLYIDENNCYHTTFTMKFLEKYIKVQSYYEAIIEEPNQADEKDCIYREDK